jgi:uncharacterized Zn-binding protein involved in type VI secretion
MAGIARLGDMNEMKGGIQRGAATVFANGIAVGLHVSPVAPHPNYKYPHKTAKTTSASSSVFAEGSQVLKNGSSTTCGHSIVQGSPDVNVP